MGRSSSRQSRSRLGRLRSAMRVQAQYWKMYAAMKLRRLRVPTPLVLLVGAVMSFFVLGLMMASVVAIDIITTLFLLCRKVFGAGRHPQGKRTMPAGSR